MPRIAINFGRLLVLIGIIGYAIGYFDGKLSATALIPAAFGIVLMILGYIGHTKESLRKHVMHVAVLVGLVGFLASAGRLLSKISTISFSPAVIAQIAMALTCLAFVIVCVRSFMKARSAE
ncbi:MAG: hypothetical protein KDB79_07185 [Acidobacteria bacterium]|nr:hypothetical protein [Acidobacteriota bacterium]